MCQAWMLKCRKCASKKEEVYAPCENPRRGLGCPYKYVAPPEHEDEVGKCSKCNGHYITEKVKKPAKDAERPKTPPQPIGLFTSFLGKGGHYVGRAKKTTYLERKKGKELEEPVDEGADEPAGDPGPETSPEKSKHRRHRRRRSQREEPDGGRAVLVDEFDLIRVSEDGSPAPNQDPPPAAPPAEPEPVAGPARLAVPGSSATAGSNGLPPLPSSHATSPVSRNTADSGRRSLSAFERANRERNSNSGSGRRRS